MKNKVTFRAEVFNKVYEISTQNDFGDGVSFGDLKELFKVFLMQLGYLPETVAEMFTEDFQDAEYERSRE